MHPDNIDFLPKQQTQYLGFPLDSVCMKISLPSDRRVKGKALLQCSVPNLIMYLLEVLLKLLVI